jgi:hypothetical protein
MYVTRLRSGTIYFLPVHCTVNDSIKVRNFPDTSGFNFKSLLCDMPARRLADTAYELVQ